MPESQPAYVELHAHSNFSFQEGASSVEELVKRAVELGYPALALTDHDNLCGAMRFARKARRAGLRPITGAEVTVAAAQQTPRPEPAAQALSSSRAGKRVKGSALAGAAASQQGHSQEQAAHLTLLATSPTGYAHLCNLLSFSHYFSDRRNPELDPRLLPEHAEGLIALSGCARGAIPRALDEGRFEEASAIAKQHVEWFGEGNFFLELQQNLVHGDTQRIRRLVALGRELGIPLVATNNVHYHVRDRHRLQDCLVAIRNRKSLETSHQERRANAEFYLKSPEQMARLFAETPDALASTLVIAERCTFEVERDLTYRFPDYPVPEGHTPTTYLDQLCREAAVRKFGHISPEVDARLKEEMRRLDKHNLAGLLLIYHEIVGIAREVQVDLGLVDPETPIEESPPGRGRGSSVALEAGYLLGISHIDPLTCGLTLDRFLPEELASVPDIDLDFPRDIREELIKRVHERWGWQHAALTGAISTYKIRGAIRDLGMALGLPAEQIDRLAKGTEHATAGQVREEMLAMPGFRDKVDAPVWRDLIDLASQLDGFPRGLGQHPGGMIISSTPLIDQVPVHQAAMEGRYICHWDKDSIDDAGFVKIDLLAIGALSQMQEAVRLIEQRTGEPLDLSRIGYEDPVVYEMLHRADTIGIFQVESAAQMQTITRIKPRNLTDMAYEVAAVRPGVGANDGVSEFIRRRTAGIERYDHPLEEQALKRTRGIILFQDQFNELAVHVAGFRAKEADELRRAFMRRDEMEYIESYWWPKFREGALANGVDLATATRIFKKFNGQYMFPEAHAYAFGATAYQMSWLKCYYPLEFFVGLFNEQPMGFYNIETLKEDAKRHGVPILHPDVNRSAERATVARALRQAQDERGEDAPYAPLGEAPRQQSVGQSREEVVPSEPLGEAPRQRSVGQSREEVIEQEGVLLGLLNVREVGPSVAEAIVREREANGPYVSVADLMERAGLRRESLDNLADAGALDSLALRPPAADPVPRGGPSARRRTKWEIGLRYRPVDRQLSLRLPVEQDMAPLPEATPWEVMTEEYRTMGLHPSSHLMAYLRDSLPGVLTSEEVWGMADGAEVRVAGLVVRRQRPSAKAYFITLEDEHGHTPMVVWPGDYVRLRHLLKEPVLLIVGTVSWREGTMNVVVRSVEALPNVGRLTPRSKDWG